MTTDDTIDDQMMADKLIESGDSSQRAIVLVPRNDPLMFVKIHNNHLYKQAVEQIKLAEEVKITKEKIKEVEEEWQNNLMSWKSKRRQSKYCSQDESGTPFPSNRKTRTFSEILSDKAKSGHRIGYNLDQYLEEQENQSNFNDTYDNNSDDTMDEDNSIHNNNTNNNKIYENNSNNNEKSNLGDVIVFDTSLLKEFSYTSNNGGHSRDDSDDSSIIEITNNFKQNLGINCDQQNDNLIVNKNYHQNTNIDNKSDFNDDFNQTGINENRIKVEIKDWNQQNINHQKDNDLINLLKHETHQQQEKYPQSDDLSQQDYEESEQSIYNNSYDAEDDDEEDEELERLERLEQEKSFKAKLSAFESLAKNDEINNQNNRSQSKYKHEELKLNSKVEQEVTQNQQLSQPRERPVVYGGQQTEYDNREESEEIVNARIQQLHKERQRAQRQPIQCLNQEEDQQLMQPHIPQQSLNVIYQSPNYNKQPVLQSQQSLPSQRQQYDQQQYFLMDEPINKHNQQIPVRSQPQVRPQLTKNTQQVSQNQPQLPYQQPISTQPEQEHLYVNQKQLFDNQIQNNSHYESVESRHQRYGSSDQDYYSNYESTQHVPQTAQQLMTHAFNDQPPQLSQTLPSESTYGSQHNQYLYCPKPYATKPTTTPPSIQNPSMVSHHQKQPQTTKSTHPAPLKQHKQSLTKQQQQPQQQSQQQSGYNHNHWLLQEAELRRQLATIPGQTAAPSTVPSVQRPSAATPVSNKSSISAPQKGMLSVSGKKKCSSCGDELGRGCAAMVVESLSLYYHINCFRCSVCNIQLGNGTVGTDVRVRNHKLHCQNCYSNDEAGLKFSRV